MFKNFLIDWWGGWKKIPLGCGEGMGMSVTCKQTDKQILNKIVKTSEQFYIL